MKNRKPIKTLGMNLEKKHTEDLGLSVPKDYFSSSKKMILDKIKEEEENTQKVSKVVPLYRRKIVLWSASVAAVLLLGVFTLNPSTTEIDSNDVLLASVVTEDTNVDDFVDDFIDEELLTDDVFSE